MRSRREGLGAGGGGRFGVYRLLPSGVAGPLALVVDLPPRVAAADPRVDVPAERVLTDWERDSARAARTLADISFCTL